MNDAIIVPIESDKQRLDIFLSKKLKISRSQVQKMIEKSLVKINSELPKKAGSRLKITDKITILKKIKNQKTKEPKNEPTNKIANKLAPKKFKVSDIKIVKETDDYLIINKPTGLLVHPTQANEKNTLVDLLIKKYPIIKKVGEDLARPGIVHRLDKEASGLMVVAKTQDMFEHLKQQFKKRKVKKKYMVLTYGKVLPDNDTINFPIIRSKKTERMASVPGTKNKIKVDEGKDALTEFWIEKRFINFTLLRVKIYTGRTHQIRTHMLAYNHPIVGDNIYYNKKQPRKWGDNLGRLFLHCIKLGFVDLENNKQNFESKLPKHLQEFLKIIK